MTNKTESRGQKTVLIVEDQALMRQTLHDFLQGAFPELQFSVSGRRRGRA